MLSRLRAIFAQNYFCSKLIFAFKFYPSNKNLNFFFNVKTLNNTYGFLKTMIMEFVIVDMYEK